MMNPWKLKSEMCAIGRRMVERGLVAAFEGNISARLGPDRVLCTPNLVCKGSLQPEDLASVDMTGKQVAGQKPCTSELLLHLAIYRRRPDVAAIVHAHPPHATAFAMAHEPIPGCLTAEAEVFLGEVPLAPYVTPGTQAVGDAVAPYAEHANAVLLANHGTVSFGKTLEEALFRTEILEAYCRSVILSRQIGTPQPLGAENVRALLASKQQLGLAARRSGLDDKGTRGTPPQATRAPLHEETVQDRAAGTAPPAATAELESLIREIADRVMAEMNGRPN